MTVALFTAVWVTVTVVLCLAVFVHGIVLMRVEIAKDGEMALGPMALATAVALVSFVLWAAWVGVFR